MKKFFKDLWLNKSNQGYVYAAVTVAALSLVWWLFDYSQAQITSSIAIMALMVASQARVRVD